MRVVRLFTEQALKTGELVILDKASLRHARKVLRLKAGSPIVLFNGDGMDYPAQLTEDNRAHILSAKALDTESSLSITLVQGISRSEKMDFTLQKATELGVRRIQPVYCQRTVVRLDRERTQRKVAHWQSVIRSACEQCGRARIPCLQLPLSFSEYLDGLTADGARLMLDPESTLRLSAVDNVKQQDNCSVMIGPEGGFDTQERLQAIQHGFTGVSLGSRILRTETASLAVLSILQSRFGDL